jgi:small conductance mechanosensitive channel
VRIKTVPGTQWGVGRAYNRLVKYHLDAAGIEIPFPHMTLYFGEDKEGKAPPAPIMIQSGRPEDSQASVPGIKDRHAKTNAKEGEDYDEPD